MCKYATLPERKAVILSLAKHRVTEMFVHNHPNTRVHCRKQNQETVLGCAISGGHGCDRDFQRLVVKHPRPCLAELITALTFMIKMGKVRGLPGSNVEPEFFSIRKSLWLSHTSAGRLPQLMPACQIGETSLLSSQLVPSMKPSTSAFEVYCCHSISK